MEPQLAFPLEDGTRASLASFDILLSALEETKNDRYRVLMPIISLRNQRDRLRIWAESMGALQHGITSLDSRFREPSLVKTTISIHLEQLQEVLKRATEVIQGIRPPLEETIAADPQDWESSEDGDNSDEDSDPHLRTELGQAMSEITSILSDLFRLSSRMGNPAVRMTTQPIIQIVERNLSESCSQSDRAYVQNAFRELQRDARQLDTRDVRKEADEPDYYLIERWVKSITNRRLYFTYWQKHPQGLAGDEAVATIQPPPTSLKRPQDPAGGRKIIDKSSKPNPVQTTPAFAGNLALSGTKTFSYDLKSGHNIDTQSITPYVDVQDVELPQAPSVQPGQSEFLCPYCWIVCPVQDADEERWRQVGALPKPHSVPCIANFNHRQHILRDLQPYMCTYPNCSDADAMYGTRTAWLHHEEQVHRRVWRCFDHTDMFESKEALEHHLQSQHQSIGKYQIESIVDLSYTSISDARTTCPFCLSQGPFREGFENHVAHHQERLASFALHKSQEIGGDASKETSAYAKGIASSVDPPGASLSVDAVLPSSRLSFLRTTSTSTVSVTQIGGELGRLKAEYYGQDGMESGPPNYIPGPVLQEFWKIHDVSAVLNHYGVSQSRAIVTESFLRAFSLLVYIDKVKFLDDLIEPNLRDAVFPLAEYPRSWPPDTPVYNTLFKKIAELQWIFFPVIFSQRMLYNQVLGPRHILPIRPKDLIKMGETVQVHKVEVDPACTDSDQTTFIRKTYDERGKDEYERERKIFNYLQSRHCDHIVGYYGSYRQRRHNDTLTYNLILEYIDGGNLEHFYLTMNPPQHLLDVEKVWRSFWGVLEGLHQLHYSMKYLDNQTVNLDIKPDHLLVSRPSNSQAYDIRLIIADFGYSRSRFDKGGEDCGQTYAAPECSHHAHYARVGKNHITPKANIWSLGCVVSEAAVWMKFGQEGRDDYRRRRIAETSQLGEFGPACHRECFHDGAQVLRAVRDTHDFIRATDPFDTITLKVLDMIEDFMLVPQQDRQEAQTLREQLVRIMPPTASPDQHHTPSRVSHTPGGGYSPMSAPPVKSQQFSSSRVPTRSFSAASTFKHYSTPPRLESWQLPQPSSTLTFDEAREWYENAKKPGSGVDPRVEAVIMRLKNNVQGRDHIFFIDNSITMGDHFRQIKDAFKILAYLAKQFSPDGVELYFSSQASKRHHGDTTKLLAKLYEQQWDQMSFEDRIGTFVDMVIIPRLKSRRQRLGFSKPRPLTIFVMTDGRWGVGREGAAGIEGPIQRLIDEILHRKLSRTQVALQFLRFGDDEDGKRYLAYLDKYGEPSNCDCVDTKSIDGNIFDMFVGSINPEIDGVEEEEPAEMSSTQRLSNRPAPH